MADIRYDKIGHNGKIVIQDSLRVKKTLKIR